MFTDIQKLN